MSMILIFAELTWTSNLQIDGPDQSFVIYANQYQLHSRSTILSKVKKTGCNKKTLKKYWGRKDHKTQEFLYEAQIEMLNFKNCVPFTWVGF